MPPLPVREPLTPEDVETITRQLGRAPRAAIAVASRCPCGSPAVVQTSPRLPDGTPFPTLYYLTCRRAASAIGALESSGLMRDMEARLAEDADLAAHYRRAHESYVAERETLQSVTEVGGVSAGGMPSRVKCLHVLAAHSLACGPGVNPLGDEVVAALGEWWAAGPCAEGQE
ncbi:MAG: DUF501 domain-containing protein [Actinomycetes bacterium]